MLVFILLLLLFDYCIVKLWSFMRLPLVQAHLRCSCDVPCYQSTATQHSHLSASHSVFTLGALCRAEIIRWAHFAGYARRLSCVEGETRWFPSSLPTCPPPLYFLSPRYTRYKSAGCANRALLGISVLGCSKTQRIHRFWRCSLGFAL